MIFKTFYIKRIIIIITRKSYFNKIKILPHYKITTTSDIIHDYFIHHFERNSSPRAFPAKCIIPSPLSYEVQILLHIRGIYPLRPLPLSSSRPLSYTYISQQSPHSRFLGIQRTHMPRGTHTHTHGSSLRGPWRADDRADPRLASARSLFLSRRSPQEDGARHSRQTSLLAIFVFLSFDYFGRYFKCYFFSKRPSDVQFVFRISKFGCGEFRNADAAIGWRRLVYKYRRCLLGFR